MSSEAPLPPAVPVWRRLLGAAFAEPWRWTLYGQMLFVLGWGMLFLIVTVGPDRHSILQPATIGLTVALLSAPAAALIAELIVMVRLMLQRQFRGAAGAGLAAVVGLASTFAFISIMLIMTGGK